MSKRPARRVLAHVLDSPWMITEDSLRTIVTIAQREHGDIEAIAAKLGRPLDNTHTVTVRDGVASIPVEGPMFRRADFFTEISGGTTYDQIATDLTTALDDPKIRGIILPMDSPGGEVTGVSELAQLIRAGIAVKPIVAQVEGMACSAAYYLAAACSEIVAGNTALLGSIGVRTSIYDNRDAMAAKGVKVHEIISSQSPGKASDPATTEGRARIQATLDALAEQFIADVAKYRGVSTDKVMKEFGAGDVLVGPAAVSAGLADRIGTYESVLAELASRPTGARPSGPRAATTQEHSMNRKDLEAAHPELVAALKAEGSSDAQATHAAAVTAAVTAERERILAIDALPIAGHDALRTAAKAEAGCTAAMLSERVIQAEATARGTRLNALKGDETKLAATAPKPAPSAGDDAPSGRARGKEIAARHAPHTAARS